MLSPTRLAALWRRCIRYVAIMRINFGLDRSLGAESDDWICSRISESQRFGGSVVLLRNNTATLPFFVIVGDGHPLRKRAGFSEACAMSGVQAG